MLKESLDVLSWNHLSVGPITFVRDDNVRCRTMKDQLKQRQAAYGFVVKPLVQTPTTVPSPGFRCSCGNLGHKPVKVTVSRPKDYFDAEGYLIGQGSEIVSETLICQRCHLIKIGVIR